MKLKANGIVIKENSFGESNRVITILTAEYGVIRAFVHGASSLKNRNITATSLLSYSSFSLTQTNDTYRVDEASSNEIFFSLRSDIEKVSLAQYFCELFAFFAPAEADATEYLRLILNSLSFLAKGSKDIRLIKAVTELYLLKLCGYMPDITSCAECGVTDGKFSFNLREGVILCNDCSGNSGISLSGGALTAMRYILFAPFEKIYSFSVSQATLNEIAFVIEKFLLLEADRDFKTLSFYNSIKSF